MKKTAFVLFCGTLLAGTALFAQDANTADLQKTAETPEVQKEFAQPDGAVIFLKEDGSFQILARGTGTYDSTDVDELKDARKEATLKAKAALAKFMKEKLATEESLATASKKVKTITSDGKTQTANITKENVRATAEVISNSAKALLRGVITLKEQKIPRKGASGEIQVTVGVSSKTLKAAGKLENAIKGKPDATTGASTTVTGSGNNAETKKAVTDF